MLGSSALTLTSERLTLRPFAATDLDLAIEMFTDPVVLKYADGAISEAEVRDQLPNWVKRGGNGCIGIWCICDRESGKRYGSVALLPIPIDRDDTDYSLVVPETMPDGDIEVGYFLKPSAWGQGYATEACKRILQFAFEESPLKEVVATFDDENSASIHVLQKAGFIDHGRMKVYAEDGPIYRITRAEWSEAN